jgi:hypothetical protein
MLLMRDVIARTLPRVVRTCVIHSKKILLENIENIENYFGLRNGKEREVWCET